MKKSNLLLIASFMLVSVFAYAQPGNQRQGQRQGKQRMESLERIQFFLDLDDDQASQIEKLRITHMSQMQKYKAEERKIMASLQSAIINDEGKGSINKWVNQRNEVEANQFTEKINHQLEVRALLTDEQKVKFDQRLLSMKNNDKKRQGPHEKHRGPHGGK